MDNNSKKLLGEYSSFIVLTPPSIPKLHQEYTMAISFSKTYTLARLKGTKITTKINKNLQYRNINDIKAKQRSVST